MNIYSLPIEDLKLQENKTENTYNDYMMQLHNDRSQDIGNLSQICNENNNNVTVNN